MIDDALTALREGLIVGFPTDTVYGIGVDPFTRTARFRLFEAKGRPEDKAIPILCADLDAVQRIAVVHPSLVEQLSKHWPGGLTAVLPRADSAPNWVGDPPAGTVGVRIPEHPVASELLSAFGPLAVTSANPTGAAPALTDAEAKALLGDRVAVYLAGESPGGISSTVIDLTGLKPVTLRAGPVVWEEA